MKKTKAIVFGVSSFCTVFMAQAANASEGGGNAYPLGAETVNPGILPPKPGLYWQHYTQLNHSGQVNGPDGEPRPVPNFDLRVIGNAERLIYVTNMKLAGGQVVLQTIVPHGDIRFRAGAVRRHAYQLGDISGGAFLSWHSPKLHGWIGPNIYFPTGGYNRNEPANIGRNVITYSLQGGVTYLPTPKIELGLKGYAAFTSKNEATQYQSGEEIAIEYLVAYRAKNKIRLGIQGGSVAKIVKLEHAWRRLNGWSDDGFQVAPFPG